MLHDKMRHKRKKFGVGMNTTIYYSIGYHIFLFAADMIKR